MRSRAEQLGGTFTVTSPPDSQETGTRLMWVVPLELSQD
jgi:signal transduction histidine kinase